MFEILKGVIYPAYLTVECGFTREKSLCYSRKEAKELIKDVADKEDAERLSYAVEVTCCFVKSGKLVVLNNE